MLTDSNGYTFTYRKTYAFENILWRCSVQNKTTCSTSVEQARDTFIKSGQLHCHKPTSGTATTVRCTEKMLGFTSESFSAEEITNLETFQSSPTSLRNKDQTTQLRSTSPSKMITYLLTDISNNDRNHLLFDTDRQLQLLVNAKVWYADGTFRAVRQSFSQLSSIHAFVGGHDNKIKQVPLD